MKKLFLLLLLLPVIGHAQVIDSRATMDIYGCQVYTLKAFIKGTSGLDGMHKKMIGKKTKTVYVSKQPHTTAMPEVLEGMAVKYINIAENAAMLQKEVQNKTGAVVYLSPLSLGNDTCQLWLMPISFKKEGNVVEAEYNERGCEVFFYFNKGGTNKLGYAKTNCPQ